MTPGRTIEDILNLAVWAPSGDNCQPWRFEVYDNKIDIFNVPDKDKALYNFRQSGSMVAHGALIENIFIITSQLGYEVRPSFPPAKEKNNLVASLTLTESKPKEEPLYNFIKVRTTNRKPYKKHYLSPEIKENLLNSVIGEGGVVLIEDEKQKHLLGRSLSANEQILFENAALHKSFFSNVVWNKREEQEKKSGLYLKTLELPPPARLAFHLFSSWNWLKFLNKLGLSRSVAKTNAKIYGSCAIMGAIITPSESDEDFIAAGRMMQKIWLKATASGLGMQIMAGLPYLARRVFANQADMLSDTHHQMIRNHYSQIESIVDGKNKNIVLLFRIGDGGNPSARSSRLPAEIKVIKPFVLK
ncbi:MAG: hypothetical protein Q8R29_01840 [bacterium]|nr:hypothetical protein [bacterium]